MHEDTIAAYISAEVFYGWRDGIYRQPNSRVLAACRDELRDCTRLERVWNMLRAHSQRVAKMTVALAKRYLLSHAGPVPSSLAGCLAGRWR